MKTTLLDYIKKYAASDVLRLHMPGHHGNPVLGCEPFDITEIDGADSLFEASGIIKESENNASEIFGTHATLYSTEGSSLCIKTMLSLAVKAARDNGMEPVIAAGRNAHRAFYSAAVLLGFEFVSLPEPEYRTSSYLSCRADISALERLLEKQYITAVYVTSPDYLGNTEDIKSLSLVCKRHGVLLLVDNAHGAYLKFLSPSRHPMDSGADMCCDSAHKTLPVLTGGAYLHIAKSCETLSEAAKEHMILYGSTSPSYLILASLDNANLYISGDYKKKLLKFEQKISELRRRIEAQGLELTGDEVLKLTFMPNSYGYSGDEFAKELLKLGIVCEFSDKNFTVMMLSAEMSEEDFLRLESAVKSIERKHSVIHTPPKLVLPERVMAMREAFFAKSEIVCAKDSTGRIFASANIGCPPAVSVISAGERINASVVEFFKYYGIEYCRVTAE